LTAQVLYRIFQGLTGTTGREEIFLFGFRPDSEAVIRNGKHDNTLLRQILRLNSYDSGVFIYNVYGVYYEIGDKIVYLLLSNISVGICWSTRIWSLVFFSSIEL